MVGGRHPKKICQAPNAGNSRSAVLGCKCLGDRLLGVIDELRQELTTVDRFHVRFDELISRCDIALR